MHQRQQIPHAGRCGQAWNGLFQEIPVTAALRPVCTTPHFEPLAGFSRPKTGATAGYPPAPPAASLLRTRLLFTHSQCIQPRHHPLLRNGLPGILKTLPARLILSPFPHRTFLAIQKLGERRLQYPMRRPIKATRDGFQPPLGSFTPNVVDIGRSSLVAPIATQLSRGPGCGRIVTIQAFQHRSSKTRPNGASIA